MSNDYHNKHRLPPPRPSHNDAGRSASDSVIVEGLLRRRIPHRLLFTRTSPQIKTRNEKLIAAELDQNEVPILKNHLNQRVAYQSMFTYRLDLWEMDPILVNGLYAAQENAKNLVLELIDVLKSDATEGYEI